LAGIGETGDFRLRALRLQQEGGEVRRVQRHANRADHLAAGMGDDLADVLFQRAAESIVAVRKNQVSPPAFTSAPPVMAEVAAPTTISSVVIFETASECFSLLVGLGGRLRRS
jgi:hypothetical protein